jgi:hypothetical protein
MKSMEHRLWFLLFVTMGNALVVLVLLLSGTEPAVRLLSLPLRYLLIGPAIVAAYTFALIVALASLLTPAMSESYLIGLKRRLISPTWFIWPAIRLAASIILIGITDLIWVGLTAYYSLSGQHASLDVFINYFGVLLGIMNLIMVIKVFLTYIYGIVSRKWVVVAIDGFASLAIALVLACVMVVSPFDGLLPYFLVMGLRLIMGAFLVVQAADAAARITRSSEYRFVERNMREELFSVSVD